MEIIDVEQIGKGYYVIQNSKDEYLSNVEEDYSTMDEGGNYEFNPNIRYATRMDDNIKLPKYLYYHTDGTELHDLEHFLKLIGGRVLYVQLSLTRKFTLEEV